MIKPLIKLQDLRKRIYIKAKADKTWKFWGLYVHVCKPETLRAAYEMARKNKGSPEVDGETFEAIEERGLEAFLWEIRKELVNRTYLPTRAREKAIDKGNGKLRILKIPSIWDRVVQGAVKLILEPIFEPNFQEGSYGYRPRRTAHQAVYRVSGALNEGKTRVIDLDLKSYFDSIRHDILLKKIASRVADREVLRLIKLILKAGGKRGVGQGGVASPLFSNIYLTEVDAMLERAKEATRRDKYIHIEYARFADDLVVLIERHRKWDWLVPAVEKRLREELTKLGVEVNQEKTKVVNLEEGESISFLGFDFCKRKNWKGETVVVCTPRGKAKAMLKQKIREIFKQNTSQPIRRAIQQINPILSGWTNYFCVGNSSKCFWSIREWVEKKVRRHLMRSRQRRGFGWKRWSSEWIYQNLGLFNDYKIRYLHQANVSPEQ
ncbi:MAG: group II intron reverse transcriptase/maturase [Alphaproteobacteria bacterium 41-28]|nr:MAG: group II intron reverse transcriptase/maturase [Alphaproteobacteria bacterium 41-28]